MEIIIKEGQNIFDAMLEQSGSLDLGLEFIVMGNDPAELDWDVETGDLIESGIDTELDFVVLQSYKKRSFVPTNGVKPADDFNNDFNDDFNSGGNIGSGIGTGQIGLTFKIG